MRIFLDRTGEYVPNACRPFPVLRFESSFLNFNLLLSLTPKEKMWTEFNIGMCGGACGKYENRAIVWALGWGWDAVSPFSIFPKMFEHPDSKGIAWCGFFVQFAICE